MRDGLTSLCIGLVLLMLFEFSLRFFWPQTATTSYVNGKSLGIRDEVLGYYYRPGAKAFHKGPEFSVEYKINRHGLRDETEHPIPKPSESTRILLLGDSFTFGIGSDYSKIWPVIFENKLRRDGYQVDVVKAGAAALDTQTEVLYLERLFPQYDPDIVAIAFLPNDLHTNTPIVNGVGLSNTVKKPEANDITRKTATDRDVSLDSVLLLTRLLMSNDLLYTKLYLMTVRKELFMHPPHERERRQLQVTEDLFLRAVQYCKEKKADLLVLSIPQQFQVLYKANNYHSTDINVDFINDQFKALAVKEGFAWVETFPEMVKDYRINKSDHYFRLDGHLNARGNAFVGEFFAGEFARLYKGRLKKMKK